VLVIVFNHLYSKNPILEFGDLESLIEGLCMWKIRLRSDRATRQLEKIRDGSVGTHTEILEAGTGLGSNGVKVLTPQIN
jgi:hypothetical protein